MKPEDRIQIGVVGKPHGVRGAFHLDGCIDAPALTPGLKVEIGGSTFELLTRGGVDKRPILTFAGVDGRDAAAALRGEAVTAARSDLTPLAEGEWFADDLVGLAVVDRSGSELGRVARMTNLPSVDVLEVASPEGATILVPMLKDAIVSIEPERGTVVVDSDFLDLG